MSKEDLGKIAITIVKQGLSAIRDNTDGLKATIDYVAIFSNNEKEFNDLKLVAHSLGKEVDRENIKTGPTFLLDKPIQTPAGPLRLIKIRKPDATRPQRGAPDFKIQDYQRFKNRYLPTSGNFTLMIRKDYEMIELKGVDVLVYFPNKTLGERV